jgi:hypothetical protein
MGMTVELMWRKAVFALSMGGRLREYSKECPPTSTYKRRTPPSS